MPSPSHATVRESGHGADEQSTIRQLGRLQFGVSNPSFRNILIGACHAWGPGV